jgi:hypothetical protein
VLDAPMFEVERNSAILNVSLFRSKVPSTRLVRPPFVKVQVPAAI